jgi:hypothetical protein
MTPRTSHLESRMCVAANPQSELDSSNGVRPRPPSAVRDSLFASAAGFAAGTLFIELVSITRLASLFGTFLIWWLVAFFHGFGSATGWLIFLLPVSLVHRVGGRFDHALGMCVAGTLLGIAMTAFESYPLVVYRAGVFSMRELYTAAGALDACTATAALICLRRSSGRAAKRRLG